MSNSIHVSFAKHKVSEFPGYHKLYPNPDIFHHQLISTLSAIHTPEVNSVTKQGITSSRTDISDQRPGAAEPVFDFSVLAFYIRNNETGQYLHAKVSNDKPTTNPLSSMFLLTQTKARNGNSQRRLASLPIETTGRFWTH